MGVVALKSSVDPVALRSTQLTGLLELWRREQVGLRGVACGAMQALDVLGLSLVPGTGGREHLQAPEGCGAGSGAPTWAEL